MRDVIPTLPELLKLLCSFKLKESMRHVIGDGCESQRSEFSSSQLLLLTFAGWCFYGSEGRYMRTGFWSYYAHS